MIGLLDSNFTTPAGELRPKSVPWGPRRTSTFA